MRAYDIESPDGPEYQQMLAAVERRRETNPRRSVLVVDDEPSVRRAVGRSMRAMDGDLTVHEAENGQEALDVLEEIRRQDGTDPVLIVTDLQMPVMDGWEFIERLRQAYLEQGREIGIPVVVLSSSTGEKGLLLKKSVHGDKSGYRPIITIAKESCAKPMKYAGKGAEGLAAWLKYFLSPAE